MIGNLAGAMALVIALVLLYKQHQHRQPPSRAVVALMVVAGLALTGGVIGGALRDVGAAIVTNGTSATQQALGVAAPALVATAGIVWIGYDWKTQSIERVTPWVALIVPAVIMVAGGAGMATDLMSQLTTASGE